jgi:hypothetical protein
MNATASEDPVDPSDELMFLCLGGGNEVGRSCHIIQYKGKTVMVSRFRGQKGFSKLEWSFYNYRRTALTIALSLA